MRPIWGSAEWPPIPSRRKTELIRAQGPWRTVDQVVLATAALVAWWNEPLLLHSACGDVPPVEFEAAYHQRLQAASEAA